MKVGQAATTNGGVWITFLVILGLYIGVAVTLVLILRAMSRRFREGDVDETGGPYEPRGPLTDTPASETVGRLMPEAVAVVLFFGVTAYAVFAGADFGAGFWDLIAGGAERGDRPRAVIAHSIGPVWEANHVWLIFCLVVLWTGFPEAFASIGLTLFVPLSLAALGIVLRGSSFAFRKEVSRTSSRRNFGAAFAVSSVIVPYCMGAVAGRHRIRAGTGRGEGRRPVVELGQPHVDPGRRARRHRVRVPRLRVSVLRRVGASTTRRWWSTSGGGPWWQPSPPASWPSSASSCSTRTPATCSTVSLRERSRS